MNFKLKRKLLSICVTTLMCSLAFSTATFAASSSTPQSTTATSAVASQVTESAETAEDSIAFYLKDIPDSVFRTYLKKNLKLGNNEDESVTVKECEAIENMNIADTSWISPRFTSLSGIEHFTHLKSLKIYSYSLTSVDLTQNSNLESLDISAAHIDFVDLTKNANLKSLSLYGGDFNSVDVTKNINLKSLAISLTEITSVDLTQNINLESLDISESSVISLDLTKNINLKSLNISSNDFTSLDITQNINLKKLELNSNTLTSLDITKNSNLEYLDITAPSLEDLDISKIANLDTLLLRSTLITSFTPQNSNLKYLYISGESYVSLDFSQVPNLSELSIAEASVNSIDVSKNKKLTGLGIQNTKITSLDVSENSELENLTVSYNKLTSLDVSSNPELEILDASNNKLTSLDVSQNSNLQNLYVNSNELTYLNVSNNPSLASLKCGNNRLAAFNVDNSPRIIVGNSRIDIGEQTLNDEKLQTTTVKDGVYSLDLKPILKDNDISRVTFNDARISYDKATGIAYFTDTSVLNTQVLYLYKVKNDGMYLQTNFTLFAPPANGNVSMDVFTNANFKWYLKNKCGLDKDNDGFATKEELNAVTNIDISYDVFPNYVTSLNGIEYLPNLETLAARRQPYTVLDVSKNTNLKTLDVSQSALAELDVTNNANLEVLNAQYTGLACIDLSQNSKLNAVQLNQAFYNRNRHTATYEDGVYQLNLLSTFKGGDRRRPIFEDSRVQYDPYLGKLTFTDETILNSDITYTYNTGNPDFGMKVSMHVYAQDVNMDVFTNANFKWYLKNKCGLDKDNDGFATQAELNAVKNIDVSYDVFPNYVTSLAGIEYLPNLETLAAKRQPYTELNVSKNTNLKELNVAQSALTSLDVTKNTNLQVLNAQFAGLSCIDLSQNKSLNSAQLDQTIYNKSKYPITYVGGTYQVNLASTLPNGDISKISFDDSRIEYDSSTGIMTFTDKSILNNNITYMYNTGNPDFRMNVLVHIYD